MAKVKVSRDVIVRANDVANVLYPAGYEGKAPKAHAAQIDDAGAGEWLDKAADDSADDAPEAPAA